MNAPHPPGALMRSEIDEQPDVYRRLLAQKASLRALHADVLGSDIQFVLIAARGSSDHAALYAKYLVEIELGLPAGLVSPSTFTVYAARPNLAHVLFVAVSQSGGSPDLIDSLTAARAGGALTVAVTNNGASALAAAAQIHVDVLAGPERSVAATKTYSAELLALYLLLSPAPGDLGALPEAAQHTLELADQIDELAAPLRDVTRLVITGRGYSYPSAREAALKMMETCYMSAQAFSGADLLHGPLAMIDGDVPVFAIVSPGSAARAITPVLAALADRGATTTTVGPACDVPVAALGLPNAISPMLEIMPFQQLALALATLRGSDPDQPRGLRKVTETW